SGSGKVNTLATPSTTVRRDAGIEATRSAVIAVESKPVLGIRTMPIPERTRRVVLGTLIGLGTVASSLYLGWWLRADRLFNPWLLPLGIMAIGYVFAQIYCAWYLYLRIDAPVFVPPPDDVTVDVFIPVYDESYDLVARSLAAAMAIRYPHRTHLLDDAR